MYRFILEKFLERKAGENTEKYSIFDFENPLKSRISGGRNDQAAVKFRVINISIENISIGNYINFLGNCQAKYEKNNLLFSNTFLNKLFIN